MSERMQVKANEIGLVRLFAVDLPEEDIAELDETGAKSGWCKAALGASDLNPDYVEFFDIAILEEMGLAGYMVQGLGVAKSDIQDARSQIEPLTGHVLIVLSKAFAGTEQTLTPRAPLRWIGTFKEDGAPVQFQPIKSTAAKGHIGETSAPTPSNPHLTIFAAIVALPLVIGLLALILWLILR